MEGESGEERVIAVRKQRHKNKKLMKRETARE